MHSERVVKFVPFFVRKFVRVPSISMVWKTTGSWLSGNFKFSLMNLVELLHKFRIESSESCWYHVNEWNNDTLKTKDHCAENYVLIIIWNSEDDFFHLFEVNKLSI